MQLEITGRRGLDAPFAGTAAIRGEMRLGKIREFQLERLLLGRTSEQTAAIRGQMRLGKDEWIVLECAAVRAAAVCRSMSVGTVAERGLVSSSSVPAAVCRQVPAEKACWRLSGFSRFIAESAAVRRQDRLGSS